MNVKHRAKSLSVVNYLRSSIKTYTNKFNQNQTL